MNFSDGTTIIAIGIGVLLAAVPLLAYVHVLRSRLTATTAASTAIETLDADETDEVEPTPIELPVETGTLVLTEAEQAAGAVRTFVQSAVDNNRMFMHFQPVVDLDTEGIAGIEGFARCVDELGTVHTAGDFLGAIEQTSLVRDLDYKAFELVCAAGAELRSRGLDIPVACNFAALTLRAADFVTHLEATARLHSLQPSRIHIEVTEAVIFDEHSLNIEVLHRLSRCGFTIVLDDFGTGESSLTHLRDLPIDIVKIDRSLTAKIGQPGPERAMASAITHFANELGIDVVVEGVETAEQRSAAQQIGANRAQGWHYSYAHSLQDLLHSVTDAPVTV